MHSRKQNAPPASNTNATRSYRLHLYLLMAGILLNFCITVALLLGPVRSYTLRQAQIARQLATNINFIVPPANQTLKNFTTRIKQSTRTLLKNQSSSFRPHLTETTETTPLPQPAKGLHHVFYINLLHRTDRRSRIESMLLSMNVSSYERIHAVRPTPNMTQSCWDQSPNGVCAGQIGCQISHVKALDLAMQRGYPHITILEDDFQLQNHVNPIYVLDAVSELQSINTDWDVIGLSLSIIEKQVLPTETSIQISRGQSMQLIKILKAKTTGGYIVRDRAMQKIRDIISPEKCSVKKDYNTAIDTCWHPLQQSLNWYGFGPQIGTQGASFSDIELRNVDYAGEMASMHRLL